MSSLHSLTADERAETAETELAYVTELNRELLAICIQVTEYLIPLIGTEEIELHMPLLQPAYRKAKGYTS